MKVPKDLEQEIIEYIFSRASDHREALKVWEKNPWEAVSRYEMAVYPEMLSLPLVVPGKVTLPTDDEQMDRDVRAALYGEYYVETQPRAPQGEYDMGDGTIITVNRFGRLETNIHGEEPEN